MTIDLHFHRSLVPVVTSAFDECEGRGTVCLTDWWDEVAALDDNDPRKRFAMARLAGAVLWYANSLALEDEYATDGLT